MKYDPRTLLRELVDRYTQVMHAPPPERKAATPTRTPAQLPREPRRQSVTLPRLPGETDLAYFARASIPPCTTPLPDDSIAISQFTRWANAQSTKPPPPSPFAYVDAQRKWDAQPQQTPLVQVPNATHGQHSDPWG